MNCQTCKASCVWVGKEQSEHGKCLVGYVPKTNAECIRSMTDEELANWLAIISSSKPLSSPEWLEWLRKETET